MILSTLSLGAALLGLAPAPQEPASRPAVGVEPGPSTPRLQTNANGWPVSATPDQDAEPLEHLRTPAAPAVEGVRSTRRGPDLPRSDGGLRRTSGTLPATSLDSPLREVWQWAGQPADFAAQSGAHAQLKMHVYDASGQVVATREMTYEADLSSPDRDRLTFADGRKTYGRDGKTAWAMIDQVVWHSREREARELLEVVGLMMRVPWTFADSRYRVHPARTIDIAGQRKRMLVVETGEGTEGDPISRFEMICPSDGLLPEELRFQIANGPQRRVRLLDYQTLPPGVRFPVRRLFVSHDGRPLMEIEVLRMQCRVAMPIERFRPPARSGTPGVRAGR